MSSLRRTDLLTLSNLRNDGRKPSEIRRMRIQLGPCSDVSGSAMVQMGLTMVLASVRGPMDCARRTDELTDRAVLEVNTRVAPFAPASSDRRMFNPNTDRRIIEQSHLIQRAMEASILLHLHPRTRIEISVMVLADDGGALCAAINAATLATVDAGIAMRDLVCSCSAGVTGEDVEIVDLNRSEMSSYGGETAVYLPCAIMPQRGTVVLAQCESRLPLKTVERVLGAAMEGCEAVFEIMQATIRERAALLLAARSGNAGVETSFLVNR